MGVERGVVAVVVGLGWGGDPGQRSVLGRAVEE